MIKDECGIRPLEESGISTAAAVRHEKIIELGQHLAEGGTIFLVIRFSQRKGTIHMHMHDNTLRIKATQPRDCSTLLKILAIATFFFTNLVVIGKGMADDINLDVPRFKAGDCLVYKAPMTRFSSVVKIKELNKLTFRGKTVHFYEMEVDNEMTKMETWKFDVGQSRKFNCKNRSAVFSEVERSNKAILDSDAAEKKMLEEAQSEASMANQVYSSKHEPLETQRYGCERQAISNPQRKKQCKTEYEDSHSRIVNERKDQCDKIKLRYPLLNVLDGMYSCDVSEQ